MYRIIRQFEFSYAHRLWPGSTNELVCPTSRCTRLHGHNAVVELELTASSVDAGGFVYDFTDLERQFGEWIRNHWDHRTFLHQADPLVPLLRDPPNGERLPEGTSALRTFASNPTCEVFAESLYEVARRLGVPVSAVRFHETPRNQAEYRPSPQAGTDTELVYTKPT